MCPKINSPLRDKTYEVTDQYWAVSSCAGSWWSASLSRPCPGWSWHCGAGVAPGPARRTPLTPSHVGIAQHPLTSPSSAPSSPCGKQVDGQSQHGHKLVLIPLCTLQELTSLLLCTECGQPLTRHWGDCSSWSPQHVSWRPSCRQGPVRLIYIRGYLPQSYWLLTKRHGVLPFRLIGWEAGHGLFCLSVCLLVHSQVIVQHKSLWHLRAWLNRSTREGNDNTDTDTESKQAQSEWHLQLSSQIIQSFFSHYCTLASIISAYCSYKLHFKHLCRQLSKIWLMGTHYTVNKILKPGINLK